MIIGLPGETTSDLLETIRFLKKTRPDMINRAKLNPLPSTVYFEQLLAQGIIEKPQNWDDIVNRFVLSDFTFADMSPLEFKKLKDKMDREITLPVNYIFKCKVNLKNHPFIAVQQLVLLFLHTLVLYLPISIRNSARCLAGRLQIKSRYVFK